MSQYYSVKNMESEQPEIHIDGPIQMDKSILAVLLGLPEQTAVGIRSDIKRMDGKDITVWINSIGGECYAASVIYTALREHRGKVTVKVDGSAISAASVIAMAGDEVLMSPTSVMMIHNPMISVDGDAAKMKKAIEILEETKDNIINAYAKKCKKSRQEIAELMDAETWMGANKAVEMGFADGVLYTGDGAEDGNEPSNAAVAAVRSVYNSLARANHFGVAAVMESAPDPSEQDRAAALLAIEYAKV